MAEKKLYKATIEVLIRAEDSDEASDAVSEALQPLIYDNPTSLWKDWQYATKIGAYLGPTEIAEKEAREMFDEYNERCNEKES